MVRTRHAKAQHGARLLRDVLLEEHGFAAEILELIFQSLGLSHFWRLTATCKHLRDALASQEKAWELLHPVPVSLKNFYEPMCVALLGDEAFVGKFNYGCHTTGLLQQLHGIDAMQLQRISNTSHYRVLGRRPLAPRGFGTGETAIVSAVTADGVHLYVCDLLGKRVQKLHASTGEFIASYDFDVVQVAYGENSLCTLPLSSFGICCDPALNLVYVSVSCPTDLYLHDGPCMITVGSDRSPTLRAFVIVLDACTLARKRAFGHADLDEPRQMALHEGSLFVADSRGGPDGGRVVVFDCETGKRTRVIELCAAPHDRMLFGAAVLIEAYGLVIVGGRLVVSCNKIDARRREAPDSESIASSESDSYECEGELRVLTLEGSCRQTLACPGAINFGAMATDVTGSLLYLPERGTDKPLCFRSTPVERCGTLAIFSLKS